MVRKTIILASVVSLACTTHGWAVEVVYRQGLNGYTGARDTFVIKSRPYIDLGMDDIGIARTEDGVITARTLIKFTDLNIPAGSQITSATLNVDTRDGGVQGLPLDVAVYGLLKNFTAGTRGSQNPGYSGDGAYEDGTSNWAFQNWSPLPGDFNLTEQVTNTDIQAMLDALVDLNAWKTQLVAPPPANPSNNNISDSALLAMGDYSNNSSVGNEDVQGLLDQLVGGPARVNAARVPWDMPGAASPGIDRLQVPDNVITVAASSDIFFDVTASFTSQFQAGVEHGWLLELATYPSMGDVYVAHGSSEAGLASRRPTLTVVYESMAAAAQSTPEPSTLILLAVGGLGGLLCRARFRCSSPPAR